MPDSASRQVPPPAWLAETERRRFVRYYLMPSPRTRSLAQSEFQFRDGRLVDISVRGLCLMLDRALPVGQWLVVQLPGRRRGSSLSRLAQVLRVEPDGDGRWPVGCLMSAPSSNEQMRLLGRMRQALPRHA